MASFDDEKLIQELQSKIDSMSIAEAVEALQAAKEQVEQLRLQQTTAVSERKAAVIDVDRAKKATDAGKSQEEYNNPEYWDSRYRTSGAIKSGPEGPKSSSLYEWYLSFDEYSALLLPELKKYEDREYDNNGVLVTGCGNSTLCEDLYSTGVTNVAGMDYSNVVIGRMAKRATDMKMAELRYFHADCTDMKTEGSASYNAVVDKGTLDAIASSAVADVQAEGSNTSSDLPKAAASSAADDAADYIAESWRLLIKGGLFAVITTMPPKIFRSIAIDRIGGVNVSDWATCPKKKIRTKEGGEVFFYAVRKTADAVYERSKQRVKEEEEVQQTQKTLKTEKDDVMSGIKALLNEAANAKKLLDDARRKLDASRAKKAQAEADLEQQERRANELRSKLDGPLSDLERAELDKYAQTHAPVDTRSGGRAGDDDLDIDEDLRQLLEGADGIGGSGSDNGERRDGIGGRALKWPRDDDTLKTIPPEVSLKIVDTTTSSRGDDDDGDDGNLVELEAAEAGSTVTVSYTLARRHDHAGKGNSNAGDSHDDSLWEEDDAICLEAVAAPSAALPLLQLPVQQLSPRSSSSTSSTTAAAAAAKAYEDTEQMSSSYWLYRSDEQPFEIFEYTEMPKPVSVRVPTTAKTVEKLAGQTKLTLPTYGGWYVLTYVRTVTEFVQRTRDDDRKENSAAAQSRAAVIRRRVELGRSQPFQVLVPVHGSHPDIRTAAISSIRRRGTGLMYYYDYPTTMSDSDSDGLPAAASSPSENNNRKNKNESSSSSSLSRRQEQQHEEKKNTTTLASSPSSIRADRQLQLVVEDQRNIRTLAITGSLKEINSRTHTTTSATATAATTTATAATTTSATTATKTTAATNATAVASMTSDESLIRIAPKYCLGRIMAWAFLDEIVAITGTMENIDHMPPPSADQEKEKKEYGLRVVIEVDIITLQQQQEEGNTCERKSDLSAVIDRSAPPPSSSSLSATSLRTAYATVIITDDPDSDSLAIVRALQRACFIIHDDENGASCGGSSSGSGTGSKNGSSNSNTRTRQPGGGGGVSGMQHNIPIQQPQLLPLDLRKIGATAEIDTFGRFICRIPYATTASTNDSAASTTTGTERSIRGSRRNLAELWGRKGEEGGGGCGPLTISCGFCGIDITNDDGGEVSRVRTLPTGIFDDMMHDFICSEDNPINPLSSSEVTAPLNTLLVGDTAPVAVLHPAHVNTSVLSLQCKTAPTMLDAVFSPQVQLQMSRAAGAASSSAASLAMSQMVNIDTCTINCKRCGSYLGDGHLISDEERPAPASTPATTATATATGSTASEATNTGAHNPSTIDDYSNSVPQFALNDIRDIRLALQCVRIMSASPLAGATVGTSSEEEDDATNISVEQATSRTLLHLNNACGASIFQIVIRDDITLSSSRPPTTPTTSTATSTSSTFITIRIVSKDYRVGTSYDHGPAHHQCNNYNLRRQFLQDAVKVSYSYVTGTKDAARGGGGGRAPMKVPLEYHEFLQVLHSLKKHDNHCFGKSPFKGEQLSALLL